MVALQLLGVHQPERLRQQAAEAVLQALLPARPDVRVFLNLAQGTEERAGMPHMSVPEFLKNLAEGRYDE